MTSSSRLIHGEYQAVMANAATSCRIIGKKLLLALCRNWVVSVMERLSRLITVPVSAVSK